MKTKHMGDCGGGGQGNEAINRRWTFWSLVGAFLDLGLAYVFLCIATAASAASFLLSLVGLHLPCTCGRPHLGCLLSFLAEYPSATLASLLLSLRSRWPFFFLSHPHRHPRFSPNPNRNPQSNDRSEAEAGEQEEDEPSLVLDRPRRIEGAVEEKEGIEDLRLALEDERAARAALQQELEMERNAAASATEEAMSMIRRLQKEKSALEIDARQQRRTADEQSAFYVEEVEELQEILLRREREIYALQKEVEAYLRQLGLGGRDDDDGDGEDFDPVENNRGTDMADITLAGDDGANFLTPRSHEDLGSPPYASHLNGANSPVNPVPKAAVLAGSIPNMVSTEDGTRILDLLPLSVHNQTLNHEPGQQLDDREDSAAGMETARAVFSDDFQTDDSEDIIRRRVDPAGVENDAHVYDVHVVDDTSSVDPNSKVTGLDGLGMDIQMSSFNLAKQSILTDEFHQKTATDDLRSNFVPNVSSRDYQVQNEGDLLRKRFKILQGWKKLSLPSNQMEQSLQLQLLEEIALQLEEIKNATETEKNISHAVTVPQKSKTSRARSW